MVGQKKCFSPFLFSSREKGERKKCAQLKKKKKKKTGRVFLFVSGKFCAIILVTRYSTPKDRGRWGLHQVIRKKSESLNCRERWANKYLALKYYKLFFQVFSYTLAALFFFSHYFSRAKFPRCSKFVK